MSKTSVSVYKKYFETASDDTSLVMHRGYALAMVKMLEEQQKEIEHLRNLAEEGADLALTHQYETILDSPELSLLLKGGIKVDPEIKNCLQPKVKRGKEADIPQLDIAELGYCVDTNKLFIGTPVKNVQLEGEEFQPLIDHLFEIYGEKPTK